MFPFVDASTIDENYIWTLCSQYRRAALCAKTTVGVIYPDTRKSFMGAAADALLKGFASVHVYIN